MLLLDKLLSKSILTFLTASQGFYECYAVFASFAINMNMLHFSGLCFVHLSTLYYFHEHYKLYGWILDRYSHKC